MEFQRSHVYDRNHFFKLTQAHKVTSQTISMTESVSEKSLSCRKLLQKEYYKIKQNNKIL